MSFLLDNRDFFNSKKECLSFLYIGFLCARLYCSVFGDVQTIASCIGDMLPNKSW